MVNNHHLIEREIERWKLFHLHSLTLTYDNFNYILILSLNKRILILDQQIF